MRDVTSHTAIGKRNQSAIPSLFWITEYLLASKDAVLIMSMMAVRVMAMSMLIWMMLSLLALHKDSGRVDAFEVVESSSSTICIRVVVGCSLDDLGQGVVADKIAWTLDDLSPFAEAARWTYRRA